MRIGLAAKHYPDRWLQYIKDTSVPPTHYQRRGYDFVLGYKYLVHFLMLVGQVELADKITTAMVDSMVEDVREQPIPDTPWFKADSFPQSLSFLLQRLKWPVPMVRWRTAKEIRNLVNNPSTQLLATEMLLNYLDRCRTESEVCEVLSIIFLISPENRPEFLKVSSCIHCHSILSG